jgi:hypothetical protein
MRISDDNTMYKILGYYMSRRPFQPLESVLEVITEEFLIRISPDPFYGDSWRAHQQEYLKWAPVYVGGVWEFKWVERGLHPAVVSRIDELEAIYCKVRECWVSFYIDAMVKAKRELERRDVAATHWELPVSFAWMGKVLGLPIEVVSDQARVFAGRVGHFQGVGVEFPVMGTKFFQDLPEIELST